MERLSGLDANFLYNETPTEHMHTLKLAVLDPPEGDELPWELIRGEIASRMLTWPAFHRKVVRVPGDLNHPVWVEVAQPDMDYHLRRARIPSPGGAREMDQVVGRLAGWPLDRAHPLWQVWMLEGRADGRIAVLVKVHHCVADGVAANALLASILSVDSDGAIGSPPSAAEAEAATDRVCGHEPSSRELLAGATRDLVFDTIKLPLAVWGLRGSFSRRRAATAELEALNAELEESESGEPDAELPPRPVLDTPKTSFNRSITAARAVSTAVLPLQTMLDVRSATDTSLNDVLLTLVGGALARILHEGGEDPDRSLTASVPVSSDPPPEPGKSPRLTGNKVSNLFVSLHTELEDPLERLAAVHRSVAGAKRLHDATGPELMEVMLGYTPPKPYAWAMQRYSGLDVAELHRSPVNVIVSNVPGPRQPLWVAGARLAEFFSAGPILEGIAVNVTAWSYMDALDVMVTSCARAMSQPSRVTDAMSAILAEMGSATQD